jgi:hypothetical protein
MYLKSGEDSSNSLYKAGPSGFGRVLAAGSKLSLAYSVQANLKDGFKKGGVTAPFGALSVDWLPSPIALPEEVPQGSIGLGGIETHGPLVLGSPSTVSVVGPNCYIENTPFEAKLQSVPSAPKVAVPFKLSYQIKNKTSLHQTLSVNMTDAFFGGDAQSDGLLISGLVDGELCLAPDEEQILSYTVLGLRAGKIALPSLQISSGRYKSWVIHEGRALNRPLYIFP